MAPAADLILRARNGEAVATEALIGAYEPVLHHFVASLIGPSDDDSDVCQAVLMKMVHGLPGLSAPDSFEPWLFRIARNECADHLRRRRRRGRLFVPLSERHHAVAMAPHTDQGNAEEAMRLAVAQLSPDQQALLHLSLDRPRSYQELAGLTQLSVAAVRNRLYRARAQLRRLAVPSLLILATSALIWKALPRLSPPVKHQSPAETTSREEECPWGESPSFFDAPALESDSTEVGSLASEESNNPFQ